MSHWLLHLWRATCKTLRSPRAALASSPAALGGSHPPCPAVMTMWMEMTGRCSGPSTTSGMPSWPLSQSAVVDRRRSRSYSGQPRGPRLRKRRPPREHPRQRRRPRCRHRQHGRPPQLCRPTSPRLRSRRALHHQRLRLRPGRRLQSKQRLQLHRSAQLFRPWWMLRVQCRTPRGPSPGASLRREREPTRASCPRLQIRFRMVNWEAERRRPLRPKPESRLRRPPPQHRSRRGRRLRRRSAAWRRTCSVGSEPPPCVLAMV
mmetsp:Transcript_41583/g.118941  ORF Transcript_41583/g.118941 Transcript_41583/m.118941 type:complete len:261 (+) Transcript_41583:281-1063(+)